MEHNRRAASRLSCGVISEKGYTLDMSVVARAGEITRAVPFTDVVDMQFVKKRRKGV
jgi:hypothetical protein